MTEVLAAAHSQAGRVVVAELDYEGITYDVDTVFTDELLDRIGEVSAFQLEDEARAAVPRRHRGRVAVRLVGR